jgi:hypothetical protein
MIGTPNHPRVLAWALIPACSSALYMPGYSSPEYRASTILYTNDIHDHLIPFGYPDPVNPRAGYASMPVRTNIGAIADWSRLPQALRRSKNADS